MMARRNLISVVTVFLALAMIASGAVAAEPPLKALIIDGRQAIYHDWKTTSPVLEEILEASGLFKVDRATAPAKGEPLDDYKPDFAAYDVVIMNYDDDEGWPRETKEAFVDYVRSGGGVVVFHAANNAFPDWKEYNEIIGLGGWRGRDERSGPMVRFRDGKVVLDNSPGKGGTHPAQHEFQVVVRNAKHPIMAGLPEKWMNSKDELYSALRGPAKHLTVLATAYCNPGIGGTGEHEPILFTVSYGKGRVFHTPLGHAAGNMHCVAFIYTLQRGAEWAATGKVTQTEVPGDFPTADKAGYRESIAGPTRAAMFDDEEPTGQLMLQGDHGPVAYRNAWIIDMDSLRE